MSALSLSKGLLATLLLFLHSLVYAKLDGRSAIYPRIAKVTENSPRTAGSKFLNDDTAEYFVQSSSIPDVTFDVGDSYAGLMPVYGENRNEKLFFWFFPTENDAGKDDIVIWLNGGPGCSSMEGFVQENGPFSWKPGTFRPTRNAWAWNRLANVIWVEYPIGTGFSSGNITAMNNVDAAAQFLSVWENFINKFKLQHKNIFITGESYAGVHVPYIGAAMLDKNDKTYYNVKGALYYDPVMPYSNDLGFDHAAFPAFYRHWKGLLGLPEASEKVFDADNKKCGLDAYLNQHLVYPPPKRPWKSVQIDGCDIIAHFDEIIGVINPCFNSYHIQDTCPVLWDVLGFPSVLYTPEGDTIWFNKPEVRQAIHVPEDYKEWAECQGPVYAGSGSDNYNGTEHEKKWQTLVERTNNVLVGSGESDYVIQPNVTALGIQMINWNGKQGFQKAPNADLLLPNFENSDSDVPNWTGGNVQGKVHTERGFTHSTVKTSGHMVPQYAPAVAFRHLEYVLGRVDSLSDGAAFTVNVSAIA